MVNETWDPKVQAVNVAQLADAVRRAALENPDKRYERPADSPCQYTHTTGEDYKMVPGCIIGQGIFNLTGKVVDQSVMRGGVSNSIWRTALGATDGEVDDWGDAITVDDPMTKYLVSWLNRVQGQQDDRKKWSEAVAHADRYTFFADFAS